MDLDEAASEHNASQQFERLVFFSDAVFAIAITVLVLDLKLPPGGDIVSDLNAMIPKFVGFGVSFFVIGIYWIAHHRLFGTLKREDGKLRVVNLTFLASVVFLPFPTSALAERPSVTASVILYALAVASVGLLLILLTFAARRPGLMRPKETRGGTLHFVIRSLGAPTVFLLSTLIALREPRLATLSWLAIWPAITVFERVGRRVQLNVDGGQG